MKKIGFLVFIFFLMICSKNVLSQSSTKTDSLLFNLSLPNADSSKIYYIVGNEHYDVSEYNLAMNYYLKSLKEAEKNNNKQRKADVLNAIGNIYLYHQANYSKALEYYNRSLEIFIEINDDFGIAIEYNNIGIVYASKKEYELGLEFFLKSYKLKKEINDSLSIYITLSNIGEMYYEKKEYDESIKYLLKSLESNKNDDWAISNTLNNIAKYHIAKCEYNAAKNNLEKSINISKKHSYNSLLRNSYLIYSRLYSKQNNINLLEKYNELYLSISDTIYNEKSLRLLTEMQTKYETKETENENELLKAEKDIETQKLKVLNIRISALIGGIVIIFISLLVFIFQYKNQWKTNKVLVNKNLEIVEREKELQNAKEKVELQLNEFKKNDKDSKKYSTSELQDEEKQKMIKLINDSMNIKKSFLQSDFSLKKMAEEINSSRTYVSQVINEHYNCNFNTFINDFRIKEARRKLSEPKNKNITIEAIANEVGFKSKTSFNNAFKKFTGVTPSFFLKTTVTSQQS